MLTHGHSLTGKDCGQQQSPTSQSQSHKSESGTKGREHRAMKETPRIITQYFIEHHFFWAGAGAKKIRKKI